MLEHIFNMVGQTVFCLVTAAFLNILYIYVMTKAATILGYIMIISLEILLLAIICGFMYVALRSDDPEAEAAF